MADQITTSLAEAKILVLQGMKGEDGFSPTVEVQDIVQSLPGGGTEVIGHKVIITDANGQHIFNVMDGEDGEGGGGGAAEAVLYIAQSLTAAQKAQARENIGAGTYSKPSGGIPASDLTQAAQTSLGKADTAVQPGAMQTYVQGAIAAIPDELPDTTSASANDFLCLNAQKQPIWKTVPSAESNSFGGGS